MSTYLMIETKNLRKSFRGKKAVDNLNLVVEKGEIYGFLGPNGSGKSTTIRMLLGLVHPTEGQIFINGYDIQKELDKALSEVGALVDNPSCCGYLTGRENLKLLSNLYPNIKKSRINEVLDIVQLREIADDKVNTYSLGMKQRLGIAIALLNNPKLIILDEPTNGLDPKGMKEIKELITNLAKEQGITFFISSHLLNEIEQICTKIGVIKNGILLAQANVKDLLTTTYDLIEVNTPNRTEAETILKGIEFVKSVKPFKNGLYIEIDNGYFSKLNQLLISKDIEVNLLTRHSNSLEKLFFEITEGGYEFDKIG